MIGQLAWFFVRSRWGRLIMGGLAFLAGVRGWSAVQVRRGRQLERADVAAHGLKSARRMAAAGAAVATDRASIVARLRAGRF